MAIKISGSEVFSDDRALKNISAIDSITKSTLNSAGLGGSITITGNTNPVINSSTVYTITNYNSFATYSVSVTRGTASISGDKITFNAPSSSGISVLTVTMGGINYTFSIAVGASGVATPTVTVSDGPSNVSGTPTLTTSAFAALGASDTHASTTWRIRRVSDSVVVWQSINNTTNKTSIVVPSGNLAVSTAYVAEAIHNGTTLGASGVGTYSFTTRSEFFVFEPSSAGLPFGGGYYAGKIVSDGKTYAVVVAPRTSGGELETAWKTLTSTTSGTTSDHNGFANTAAMILADAARHPAAIFCKNLSINGYNDWYLPAKDELEICYRYLKPTTDSNTTSYGANSSSVPQTTNYTSGNPAQTSVTIFKTGNVEAFSTSTNHWSSTEFNASSGWTQDFANGSQIFRDKITSHFVRAVRRVEIPA